MKKMNARWWDAPAAICVFLVVLFASWRLETTNWTEGLGHVRNIALMGVMVGLALGQSRFQTGGTILLGIGYMLAVFLWQWLRYLDLSGEIPFAEQLEILFGRLWTGVREWAAGRQIDDPLVFLAYLGVPFWLTGAYSGYQTTRHGNALGAILPSGGLMFIVYLNHFTETDYNWLFGMYLFAAFSLVSRLKYLKDRQRWIQERVQISSESGLDLTNVALFSAAVLIGLAWILPYTPPFNAQARESWQQFRERWFPENQGEVFSFITRERPADPAEPAIQRELALGTQASQSAFVTFLVYAPSAAADIPRLYWRGYVYDRFEDSIWKSTAPERTLFEPQEGEFRIPEWAQRKNLNFTFDVYIQGQNILYVPPQPLWVSRNAAVLHADATEEADGEMDVMILQAVPPLKAGDVYRVTALLSNPTVPELREAQGEYPAWVTEQYLQLPDAFSPRIRDLALEITAAHDNAYDKAQAITDYLRREIEYAPAFVLPEEPVDPLEYFLFESKTGFCNYYASAQVLMLRAVGIPARLAVGYAQGEASLENTLYTVRERDSHAWPEVYFPGYGWVEFEPTGNQDPLERPVERVETAAPAPNPLNVPPDLQILPDEGEDPFADTAGQETTVLYLRTRILLAGAAGGILVILVAVYLKKRYAPELTAAAALKNALERYGVEIPAPLQNMLAWMSLSPIERHFHAVHVALQWMGAPPPAHNTPAERADQLKRLVPSAAPSVEILLNELHAEIFSPRRGNRNSARRAAWRILSHAIYARLKILILGYN